MIGLGVVIPARDAACDLPATLDALAAQNIPPDVSVHIVVAVNATSDETSAIAEKYAPLFAERGIGYRVIETAPGRARAFNEAERLLPTGPRLYLDQDAVLSPNALADLAAALERSGGAVHFVVPQLRLPALRSIAARCYYRTFLHLPYTRTSPVSLGAYAVSTSGRRRWDAFPDGLHSDDKFVRLHFEPAERSLLTSVFYTVALPDGISAIVRARRRYSRGNRELERRFPQLSGNDASRYRDLLAAIATRPSRWLAAAVYLVLYGVGHVLARIARS
jgi:glycosyltransferase involved in cell wall biosynthesis